MTARLPFARTLLATALALCLPPVWAQATGGAAPAAPTSGGTLGTVTVNASADASAQGLSPAYPGGQVARGGRAGILGTRDAMSTPFSITSYTNELIQDRQARSVGEVLQNDPNVRTARGFGNFQESYFIRGFILSSDDVAYNGLYSLLPRQYIATELFERVEVLRGASAFLNGANPGGGGVGGAINLLPKRAPNDPLSRVTVGAGSGSQASVAADIARRFGPDGSTGIRLNVAHRRGGTGVDDEDTELSLAAVGLDWRSRDVRLSADLGWQDNRLQRIRPNVSLATTSVPSAPDASSNFAQPWSFSNERDLFGTFRGEWDITPAVTAWGAYGLRRGEEANSLANLTVLNATTGAGSTSRFDNTREDRVDTGELGLRGKARTGSVGHEWVAAASWFKSERDTAFAFDTTPLATGLYTPTSYPQPAFAPFPATFTGGTLASPTTTGRVRLSSFALGDTLSMFDDRFLLTLGLRHQTLDIANFDATTQAQLDRYERTRTSPAVGAVWKASQQVSVFGNYIEGLTQGDTSPATFVDPVTGAFRAVTNPGVVAEPYVSKQAEVGVKYDGGRLGAGATLFRTTRPRSFIETATGTFSTNGEDRHTGVELNVFGEPVRGIRLLGGATWLSAEQSTPGTPTTDGRRVIGVPRFQATLGAEWELRAVPGLALDARVVHTGASYANDANTLRVPGWSRLDVGARYLAEVAGKPLTLRARVDNLTDRNYWASSGGFPGAGYLVVGAPRTLTVSASVDF